MELLPCNKCPRKVVNARFFTFCAKSSWLQLSYSATRVFSKKYQIRLIFSAKHFPDNLHFSFSISAKPQQGFPVVRSSHLLILTAANMKQLISHVNTFAILSSIFAPQECLQNIETNTQKKLEHCCVIPDKVKLASTGRIAPVCSGGVREGASYLFGGKYIFVRVRE